MNNKKSVVRIKNDQYSIIWHNTKEAIPELSENQKALVLMYCKDWLMPVLGTCGIGWDGSYYLEWLINDKELSYDKFMDTSDYFSPDFWSYVNFPDEHI